MSSTSCASCSKPKATLQCGLCHCDLCKYCAEILDPEAFSYLDQLSEELSHSVYCRFCYDANVAKELERYRQDLEAAKDVLVFFDHQGKETRLIKRLADPISVSECKDRDEAIMRLALMAVRSQHNGLVDIHLVSEKVRVGRHQNLKWKAKAIPVHVDPSKLPKDKSLWHKPN